MARKGSERSKDIEVEAERDGKVGAHSRAERGRSQSTDATKAGQGEGNDEGDNEVTTWSKHGNASTKRRLRGRRRNTMSKEKKARLGDRLGRAVVNRVRAHDDTLEAKTRRSETRAKRGQ